MFGHEQFKPYKLSIEFLVISMQLLDRLPKGNAHLRDQLKRASTSIPLNLAEGSGKMTNPDKLRFYAIARGSAMECAATCDVISHFEPQLSSQADRGKKLLASLLLFASKNRPWLRPRIRQKLRYRLKLTELR